MSSKRAAFIQARERLLDHITEHLRNDERFVAAWLAGSFGRGNDDWASDLDIHVVVADPYSESLCARPWMDGMRTTPERLALFQQFGTPLVVMDGHRNNQIGGTFTYVLYQESAHNVDWMLFPQSLAHREQETTLLFDKVGLPEPPKEEPESPKKLIERASENAGFFWVIAAGNVKNLIRHDLSRFHELLRWQEEMIREVQAALQGERAPYINHTYSHVYPTLVECIAALRRLCDEMEHLLPAVVTMGGSAPTSPRLMIEMRLALLEEMMA